MGSPSSQGLARAGVEAETAPIRERLTEAAEQLQRLATGAQERDRMLAMKSMAEDISLQSRGRDDKERRTRNRSKRDC